MAEPPKPRTYVDAQGTLHILSDGVHDPQIVFRWRAYQPASPWAKKDGWRALTVPMTWRDAQAWAAREGVDFAKHMDPVQEVDVIEPFFPKLDLKGTPKPPQ